MLIAAGVMLLAGAVRVFPGGAPRRHAPPDAEHGMLLFVDPVTGELRDAPPEIVPPVQAPAGARAAAPAIVEEPGTTPAGGVTVELSDAFDTTMTATVDANGRLSTHCMHLGTH